MVTNGNPANLAEVENDPRYTFVKGDIADAALIDKVLSEKPVDAIINYAAETHVDRSIDGPRDFLHTNVIGTFELLEAARHHVATCAAESTGTASTVRPSCEPTAKTPV